MVEQKASKTPRYTNICDMVTKILTNDRMAAAFICGCGAVSVPNVVRD